MTTSEELNAIESLVKAKVLGPEEMPTPDYWHWTVLKPEELPEWLKDNFNTFGEIRHYW